MSRKVIEEGEADCMSEQADVNFVSSEELPENRKNNEHEDENLTGLKYLVQKGKFRPQTYLWTSKTNQGWQFQRDFIRRSLAFVQSRRSNGYQSHIESSMLNVEAVRNLEVEFMMSEVDLKDPVLLGGDETILPDGQKTTGKFLKVEAFVSHINRPLYAITGTDFAYCHHLSVNFPDSVLSTLFLYVGFPIASSGMNACTFITRIRVIVGSGLAGKAGTTSAVFQ
ncbi:predicted protein [Sclerotinia sclerotiorum 1980 UF-70]|uniref:Uncharacterized protein n=1 Tax=Sclerotinia sclerotiorum (strain ATCC 18683 / 1980 / Ss-1) TaxID=665079 RepID=A7F6P4_SCLS1|nr:predicted protein [Sclerotinia sclerotiorum 1980 UF-70]EDN98415.1 predicted protein [Sclerotinia sclerotiorum 1980 UF-70]